MYPKLDAICILGALGLQVIFLIVPCTCNMPQHDIDNLEAFQANVRTLKLSWRPDEILMKKLEPFHALVVGEGSVGHGQYSLNRCWLSRNSTGFPCRLIRLDINISTIAHVGSLSVYSMGFVHGQWPLIPKELDMEALVKRAQALPRNHAARLHICIQEETGIRCIYVHIYIYTYSYVYA